MITNLITNNIAGLKNLYVLTVVISMITAFGCGNKPDTEQGKIPIARVYDDYLYFEDIQNIYTQQMSAEDSVEKMHEYIDKWAKRKLLRRKAELNLPDEQLDVTKQIEDYRTTLLIHKYKRKFIHQKLDTVITDDQINAYYEKHKEEYKLQRYAVKAMLIKIHKTAPNLTTLKQKYTSEREKDLRYVYEYCLMHASVFDTFNDDWIYFDDVMAIIPKDIEDVETFLSKNKTVEVTEDEFTYLLHIYEYKKPGDKTPKIFMFNVIRKILLNMKKERLINNLENDLYNDALNHENFEYFDINNEN